MAKKIKSDIPNTRFPWKKMNGELNQYVLHIGIVESLITPSGARMLGNEAIANTWQNMPVLRMFYLDCGHDRCYVWGDLGSTGGEEAVPIEKAEDYITTKIEAIAAFAKAMGIQVNESEGDL